MIFSKVLELGRAAVDLLEPLAFFQVRKKVQDTYQMRELDPVAQPAHKRITRQVRLHLMAPHNHILKVRNSVPRFRRSREGLQIIVVFVAVFVVLVFMDAVLVG